jgi:lysozyme family protein
LAFATDTLGKGVDDLLNHGVTVKGENGQPDETHPASMQDVDDFIHAQLQDFLKPKGQDRDFGSPEARAVAYNHLREITNKLRTNALSTIQTQVSDHSLKVASANLGPKVKAGLPTSFKEFYGQLVGVDRTHAGVAYVNTMTGIADELAKSVDPKDQQKATAIYNMLRGKTPGRDPLAPVDPNAPADAPQAPAGNGLIPVPKRAKPAPMSKDQLTDFIAQELEGGDQAVDLNDGAGLTKFGVSTKYNPGVDVANLTKSQAVGILKKKYWSAEFDKADPTVAAIAFDAAITGGSAGKNILAAANNDPTRALALYRKRLNHVADTVPGKEQFRQGWMNRVNRLASKLGLSASSEADDVDIPIVEGSIPRNPTAQDMAETAPLDGTVDDMTLELTPEQRSSLNEGYSNLLKTIDQTNETHRTETYKVTYDNLLGREMGIGGPKATIPEIQALVTGGKLPVQEGMQIINARKQDAREATQEARAARSEAREQRAEVRQAAQDRINRSANAFLAQVYEGKMTLSDASGKLLVQSYKDFPDADERSDFQRAVFGQIQTIKELRTDGPQYQHFMKNMDTLGDELKRQVNPRVTGERRKAIFKFIDGEVDKAKAEGGRLGQDQGYNLDTYYDTIEKRMAEPGKGTFFRNRFDSTNPIVPQ